MPANPEVQLFMGQVLLGLMRPDEAKHSFTNAVNGGAQNVAFAWVGLGWCAQMKEDFKTAEDAFSRAIELNPEMADGHAGLALVWASTGDERKHVPLARALELDPDHALALSLRATQANGQERDRDAQRVRELLEKSSILPGRSINNRLREFPNTPLGKKLLPALHKKV